MFFVSSSNLFLTIKMLIFDDINQGINKQDLGTEKVWSFFLAFSDNPKTNEGSAKQRFHLFGICLS
jgi:hypothetical protein